MRNFLLIFCAFAMFSCTCGSPFKITPIQRSDKKLACKDIILEINEAEHFRERAKSEKRIRVGEALMPICWASGYIDGTRAVQAANERIEYLGNIYDLLDCGGSGRQQPSGATFVPMMAPLPSSPPPATQAGALPVRPLSGSFTGGIDYSSGEGYKPLSEIDLEAYDLNPEIHEIDEYLHEHRDRFGRTYIHSHPHTGPHRHGEDDL